MPIYAYRCQVCGHQFEVRQSFSDEPLTVCEECGGTLRKLLGDVGVVFKGGGFYSTDSGKRSAKTSTSSAKPGTETSGSKDAGSGGTASGTTGTSGTSASSGTSGASTSSSSGGSSSGTSSGSASPAAT